MVNYSNFQKIGLILAPLIFIIMLLIENPSTMSETSWRAAAVALLLAVLWITEALPIYVTALLPILFFPVLEVNSIKETTAPYGHPLIFLFLGGFILAEGIQKWGLHKRIALTIIKLIGFKPNNLIAGFMIGSALLSMWISNTATVLMMLPIGLFVVSVYKDIHSSGSKDVKNFTIALLLSIAYASSVGGVGTLIGTPPNALLAAFMSDTYNMDISFAKWMMLGLPFVVVSLPIVYILLTRVIFPIHKIKSLDDSVFKEEIDRIGKIKLEEKRVLVIFSITASLWMLRAPLSTIIPELTDSGIAIFGALLLFLTPNGEGKPLIHWSDVQKIAWGILILFGGGLSLAQGIKTSGLADWIAISILNSGEVPVLVLVFLLTSAIVFLTELTSNLATTAAFLPVIGSVAVGLNVNPLELVIPATIAASCAFMLPVATPPNAIIFSSGELKIKDMSRAGILLNIVFIFIVIFVSYVVGGPVFGY